MKKLLLGIALVVLPAVGCMQFRPTGPLVDTATLRAREQQAAPIVPDTADLPKISEGPTPPAPTQLINADDISAGNSADAVKKLAAEIDQDRTATADFPNYSRVSNLKAK